MTELRIVRGQFPTAVPVDAQVGDHIVFTVRGVIQKIEAPLVDVSSYEQKDFLMADVETSVRITSITRHAQETETQL